MPTYSYYCSKCDSKFDAFHSMKSTEPQCCPVCGVQGKKLLSVSSVIFKGSGFYSTDYRDSGYLEAQKRDSGSTGDSSKSAEAKDSKTAASPGTSGSDKPSKEGSSASPVKPSENSSSGHSNGTGSSGMVAPTTKDASPAKKELAKAA